MSGSGNRNTKGKQSSGKADTDYLNDVMTKIKKKEVDEEGKPRDPFALPEDYANPLGLDEMHYLKETDAALKMQQAAIENRDKSQVERFRAAAAAKASQLQTTMGSSTDTAVASPSLVAGNKNKFADVLGNSRQRQLLSNRIVVANDAAGAGIKRGSIAHSAEESPKKPKIEQKESVGSSKTNAGLSSLLGYSDDSDEE